MFVCILYFIFGLLAKIIIKTQAKFLYLQMYHHHMKIINRNTFVYFLLIVFLFYKIDYRFINEMKCCSDDFDYYSHAYTITIDFDFDYSNQLIDGHSETYNYEGKIAPLGFVGSGLFYPIFIYRKYI